ncbi:MAG: glycosyltransferase family 39 protein [Thermoplasmatota archaeon]
MPGWRARIADAAVALPVIALVGRYLFTTGWLGRPIPFSYDEATYADLALHPWHSSFYPDPLFLRHPPLYFWASWVWQAVLGHGEDALRLLALVAAVAATLFLWAALRRKGRRVAALGALLWALALPLHAYLIEATMYAPALLLVSIGLWARGRPLERWALVLLCLTHWFGYVFLVAWMWGRWRERAMMGWPAALWLAFSAVAGWLLHSGRDLIGLGPSGQVVRSGSVVQEYLHGNWALPVGALAMTLLLAGPAFLWPSWKNRNTWVMGALTLCLYLAVAPPFLRYALLIFPVLLVASAPRLARNTWGSLAVVVLMVAIVPVASAYVAHGPDPSAANDLPESYDFREAAKLVAGHTSVATHEPPALAYYLGWPVVAVTSASLVLGHGSQTLTILRMGGPGAAAIAATNASLYVVPTAWNAAPDLVRAGWQECGQAHGLVVVGPTC